MLKAVWNAVIWNAVTAEKVTLSDIITHPEEKPPSDVDEGQNVSSETLQGTALKTQHWHKAHSSDGNICVITQRRRSSTGSWTKVT